VVRDPADPELDRLAARYQLHPLHVEDCRHRNQSAKVEENNGYLFMVLKPVRVDAEGSVEFSDLDIFIGRDFVITVEETEWPEVRELIEKLRAVAPERPDQALYRLADGVVDAYLPVLDLFSDRIDEIEDAVLAVATPECLARIFDTKRSLIALRRVLVNTRDVAGHLQRSESHLVDRDMWPFLRDVYDHVARSLDTVETMRDLLSGTMDVYLSTVANRTNQVMKVLTVLGTIALPALVISGIYGMNVKGLPWTDSPRAGWMVAGIMAACTAALLALLRWFRWL
jgi:magnesium transporter